MSIRSNAAKKNEEENETLAAKWNKKTATKKCPISEEEKNFDWNQIAKNVV